MSKMYGSLLLTFAISWQVAAQPQNGKVVTGQAAFTSYADEKPGVTRKLTIADLPKPYATQSAGNGPDVVSRPGNAWPQTLPGFKVEQFARGLENPRLLRTAPNGDLFLAESSAGEIKVFAAWTRAERRSRSRFSLVDCTSPSA